MPLLSEQLRLLQDEEIVTSGTQSWSKSAVHDWEDRGSIPFTLTKKQFMLVVFDTEAESGVKGAARATVEYDSTTELIATSGKVEAETVTRQAVVILAAGSYTFKFQSACWVTAGNKIIIKDVRVAVCNFPDKDDKYWTGSQSVSDEGEEIVFNQNITVPTGRKTCVGQVKKYTALIYGNFYVDDLRRNKVSVVTSSNYVTWRLWLDDEAKGAAVQTEDTGTSTSNLAYGEGAFGLWVLQLDAGQVHNIKIKAKNRTGASRTCKGEVHVVLCPWIIPYSEYSPVDLDFQQGSTLYVVAEPFTSNPSKKIRLGTERVRDFGDAANYYASSSGTDILSFNYTFEVVEVDKVDLKVEGYGGCISIIGVDVR